MPCYRSQGTVAFSQRSSITLAPAECAHDERDEDPVQPLEVSPLLRGHTIIGGKYHILASLGLGGMGEVFEAENVQTHKRVALKRSLGDSLTSPLIRRRFVREAEAVGRIRHPNVVDIYDIGSDGDTSFLVMELLVGETLAARIGRGTMPISELLCLVLPAMRGVALGHRLGVVHRDIKPENIFLAQVEDQPKPVPKVLDFGISKLMGKQEPDLTFPSSAIGTPPYMSLEQLRGDADIDSRADVYAFGVVLYEALTGKLPFEADTLLELVHTIATCEPVPVDQARCDLPAQLARIIEKAMAKDRDLRFRSLDAFIAELAPFAANLSREQHAVEPHCTGAQIGKLREVARSTQPHKVSYAVKVSIVPGIAILMALMGGWSWFSAARAWRQEGNHPAIAIAAPGKPATGKVAAAEVPTLAIPTSESPSLVQERENGDRALPTKPRDKKRRARAGLADSRSDVGEGAPPFVALEPLLAGSVPAESTLAQVPAAVTQRSEPIVPGDELKSPYLRADPWHATTTAGRAVLNEVPVMPGDVLITRHPSHNDKP